VRPAWNLYGYPCGLNVNLWGASGADHQVRLGNMPGRYPWGTGPASYLLSVAEDARFELARGCPQHAFQACALGH
jgi:hypothetical protein